MLVVVVVVVVTYILSLFSKSTTATPHSPSNGEDNVEMMQNEAYSVYPMANMKMVQNES